MARSRRGRGGAKITGRRGLAAARAEYGERVPIDQNTFSSRLAPTVPRRPRRLAPGAAGGRRHRRAPGAATRSAGSAPAPGSPSRRARSSASRGSSSATTASSARQVTLTAGLMPDLDLGPDPILRLGDGVVLGRGSHVIADTTVTHRRRRLLRPVRLRHVHQPLLRRPARARRQAVAAHGAGRDRRRAAGSAPGR